MKKTICGCNCEDCFMKDTCKGCAETNGNPFGKGCVLADCAKEKGEASCARCGENCAKKKQVISEFNALHIENLPEITSINALKGEYVNLSYPLPSGDFARFFENDRVIFANQIEGAGNGRCFGLCADDNYLMVCTYGENGADPEIICYRRRTK